MADDLAEFRVSTREIYAEVILQHWPRTPAGCACGGVRLGQSWPEHLADKLLSASKAETDDMLLAVGKAIHQALDG
jgi:hypothetical protein